MIAYLLYGGLAIAVAWVAGRRSMLAIGLLVAAIGLRIAFGFLEHAVIVFDDEGYYLDAGPRLDAAGLQWDANHWGNIAAAHHRVFGEALHPMRALNVFLGVVMALLMGRIARLLRAAPKTEECVYYLWLSR